MEHTMLIGMPVYEGVNLLDVTGPYEMFGWADLDVRLFAEAPGLVACRGGLSIEVTAGFDHAPAFDVLWVPGGDPNALARLMGDPRRVYLDFLLQQSAHALCFVGLRGCPAACRGRPARRL
jgi:putative intracellular protease/amidase